MRTHTPLTASMQRRLRKTAAAAAILVSAFSLSGCLALPGAFQIGTLMLDGISFATSGKTVTDNALSGMTQRDCAMLRALDGSEVCTDGNDDLDSFVTAAGPAAAQVQATDMTAVADFGHGAQDMKPEADQLAHSIVPARLDDDFRRKATFWDPSTPLAVTGPINASKF